MDSVSAAAKLCKVCGETKPLAAFHRSATTKSGLVAHCRKCQYAYNRRSLVRRQAAGQCTRCAHPVVAGTVFCADHTARLAEKRRLKRSAGLCFSCPAPATTGAVYCRRCWLRRMAERVLGDRRLATALDAMWQDQGGRCALSGVPLEQGSASLDHITHRSKGGADDIANVRWVHLAVNLMRRDLTDDSFYEWCRLVVARRSPG